MHEIQWLVKYIRCDHQIPIYNVIISFIHWLERWNMLTNYYFRSFCMLVLIRYWSWSCSINNVIVWHANISSHHHTVFASFPYNVITIIISWLRKITIDWNSSFFFFFFFWTHNSKVHIWKIYEVMNIYKFENIPTYNRTVGR